MFCALSVTFDVFVTTGGLSDKALLAMQYLVVLAPNNYFKTYILVTVNVVAVLRIPLGCEDRKNDSLSIKIH